MKRRCRLLKEVRDAVEFSQVRVNTCVFVCLFVFVLAERRLKPVSTISRTLHCQILEKASETFGEVVVSDCCPHTSALVSRQKPYKVNYLNYLIHLLISL